MSDTSPDRAPDQDDEDDQSRVDRVPVLVAWGSTASEEGR